MYIEQNMQIFYYMQIQVYSLETSEMLCVWFSKTNLSGSANIYVQSEIDCTNDKYTTVDSHQRKEDKKIGNITLSFVWILSSSRHFGAKDTNWRFVVFSTRNKKYQTTVHRCKILKNHYCVFYTSVSFAMAVHVRKKNCTLRMLQVEQKWNNPVGLDILFEFIFRPKGLFSSYAVITW